MIIIKYAYSKNQQRYFECKCDCGNTTIKSKARLNFENVKSCGCLKKPYKDLEDVFKKNAQMKNECLEWVGSKNSSGYGQFKFQGTKYIAHRTHWELRIGKIPEGMVMAHHCDNKACVRIEHLFPALPSHNSKDMVRKNRQAKGSRNGSSKLAEDQVREIKKILRDSPQIPISEIAKKFKVYHSTIRRIQKGQTWSHVKLELVCDGINM